MASTLPLPLLLISPHTLLRKYATDGERRQDGASMPPAFSRFAHIPAAYALILARRALLIYTLSAANTSPVPR